MVFGITWCVICTRPFFLIPTCVCNFYLEKLCILYIASPKLSVYTCFLHRTSYTQLFFTKPVYTPSNFLFIIIMSWTNNPLLSHVDISCWHLHQVRFHQRTIHQGWHISHNANNLYFLVRPFQQPTKHVKDRMRGKISKLEKLTYQLTLTKAHKYFVVSSPSVIFLNI